MQTIIMIVFIGIIGIVIFDRITGKSKRLDDGEIVYPKNDPYFMVDMRIAGIAVDRTNKRFKLDYYPGKLFEFEDVIKYQLNENGQTVTSGGLSVGRALVGSALFGGVGAIVGGVTGKRKSMNTVDELSIGITMRGREAGLYKVPIITKRTRKSSKIYQQVMREVEQILSVFDIMVDETQRKQ